ncbi:aromatic amino acid transport family protein [Gallaecimonas sp. GXIMD4217]|uniref:aromatic amino acid transport family protein n=1 Tax=Gallaecimonas sp. GXIMD4217 TaxID=3131927 RepID=UPI00311AF504
MQKTLGSALIVAGTTIGAGMLALPLASAHLGFFYSALLLVACWLLAAFAAWVMADLFVAGGKAHSLDSLATETLGKSGRLLTGACMGFLYYALMAAYISGGASLLAARFGLDGQLAAPLFTLAVAAVVTLSTRSVDLSNRLLFSLKLLVLVLVFNQLMPDVDSRQLLPQGVVELSMLTALPVVFTSFGFHGGIPSLVGYLDGDRRRLRLALIAGSALPLLLYLGWQAVIYGSVGSGTLQGLDGSVDAMLTAVGGESGLASQGLKLFADLALATSFLGVALGLFDFMAAVTRRSNSTWGRLQTTAITFLPPLLVALFYPDGFIAALGYAAIALAMLALVIPGLISHRLLGSRGRALGLIASGGLVIAAQVMGA